MEPMAVLSVLILVKEAQVQHTEFGLSIQPTELDPGRAHIKQSRMQCKEGIL